MSENIFSISKNDFYHREYYLLLLLKEVGVQGWESDLHPISPKTLAPQYQPINRKKRKGKIV